MSELFISPILFDYAYLEDLCQEAKQILKIELKDKKSEDEFKTSIFLNFNRYLTIEMEMMSPEVKDGLYEDLAEFMEKHQEEETVKLLTNLEILPEAKEEFLQILKNLK